MNRVRVAVGIKNGKIVRIPVRESEQTILGLLLSNLGCKISRLKNCLSFFF